MIDRSEVLTIAGERDLRVDMIEKDYVLGWLLAGISAHPVLGPAWVFKGGTCLKKCFIETYRLSEDLDFTVEDAGQLDEGFLVDAFLEIAEWTYDQSGIDISTQHPRFRTYRNSRGGLQIEGRVYYRGPMQPRGSLPRVKLDLTADEKVVHRPVERAVAHPYSDYPAVGIAARTYPLTELVGEKIRALGERARPRDLYDVISLFRRQDLRPEAPAVLQVLREKCEFKGIPIPNPTSLQPFREEIESDWEVMLGHQLPAVPPIGSFWSAIPEFFTWLHGSIASSSPTGIPLGPNEEVVSASSTSQDLGMDAPALERIRFAAANRLCIDLGYQGDLRRVEPYSLRRTRDGDVVLYVCEVGAIECVTYRTKSLSEVGITSQAFAPKYAIELLLPSSIVQRHRIFCLEE